MLLSLHPHKCQPYQIPSTSELLHPFFKKSVSLPPIQISPSGFSAPQPELAVRNRNLSFHLHHKRIRSINLYLAPAICQAQCWELGMWPKETPGASSWGRRQMMAPHCPRVKIQIPKHSLKSWTKPGLFFSKVIFLNYSWYIILF